MQHLFRHDFGQGPASDVATTHGVRVQRLMTDQNHTYRVSRAFARARFDPRSKSGRWTQTYTTRTPARSTPLRLTRCRDQPEGVLTLPGIAAAGSSANPPSAPILALL